MKMKVFSFENDIIFSEEYISVLQIEEKILFTRIIEGINSKILDIGDENMENIVLLEGEDELDFKKDVLLITDPWSFDFNQKKVQTRLFKYIENEYTIDSEKMKTFISLFQKLEIEATDIWDELPFEFEYKNMIGLAEYLKLLGLKIKVQDNSIIQRVMSIIDVIEYFQIAKLVIFVNIKLFFSEEQLREIYKYAQYKKVMLLLLETGKEEKPLSREKIYFIDSDYDEIILYNEY